MPTDISPKQIQEYAHKGVKRLKNFRNARLMFLRNYVGQYYDTENGEIGGEALNLIFNAVRTFVPTVVMTNPKHNVHPRYVAYKQYAEMLSLALTQQNKELQIAEVYRRAIVDALFTLGILKTGIAESDSIYAIDDDRIDTGEVYTEVVDFDNLVVDPRSNEYLFQDAQFLGDKICIPRQTLLDSGLYDNTLVEKLPGIDRTARMKTADQLSKRTIKSYNEYDLQDEVEIIELWVPGQNTIITIPGDKSVHSQKFLRVEDYYGPNSGPYTFLALTPPVPNNPLPVPAVGIWNDLHILANRMAKKIVDQAERQKDLVVYRPAAADDAQEALDAGDGEALKMDDPEGVKTLSFGGQQNSNEVQLANLQGWFNMMAANPNQTAGLSVDANSATEARILHSNANVGLEDMKAQVYKMAAKEGQKRAWYLHTDPFIHLPLIGRETIPAQYEMTQQGPFVTQPAQQRKVQIFLTPEARRGDFLDYNFDVEPESMGLKDQATRYQQAMDFAVKILPATFQAAMAAAQLGIPFSAKAFLINMAKDRGIDWLDEVFYDPEFQQQMMMQMLRMPSPQGSKGIPGMESVPNPWVGQGPGQTMQQNPLGAILQNGQPGQVMSNPTDQARGRQQAQAGANMDQSQMR